MAILQMEIIVRTIQISRHYGDIIGSILKVKALAHLQTGNLGNGIRLVGILQRRSQQYILSHRLRSISGIDAGAAQKEQFFDLMTETLSNDILLNLQIIIDKVGTIQTVGHNTPDMSGSQNDIFRLLLIKELLYSHRIHQVQFLMGASDKICKASLFQITPDS